MLKYFYIEKFKPIRNEHETCFGQHSNEKKLKIIASTSNDFKL